MKKFTALAIKKCFNNYFKKNNERVNLISGSEIPLFDSENPENEEVFKNKLKSFRESRSKLNNETGIYELIFTLFSDYDFNGNKIYSGSFNPIGNNGYKKVRKYDAENKLTEKSHYFFIDNTHLECELLKYDASGLLIELKKYSNLKQNPWLIKDSYNLKGTDLYFDSKIIYYYDDNSNVIEEYEIMYDNEIYSKTTYYYNNKSNLTEKIENNYRHVQYKKHLYEYENNNLIGEYQYHLKEYEIRELKIRYNKKGLKIESEEKFNDYREGWISIKQIEYIYDTKNVLRERYRKQYVRKEDSISGHIDSNLFLIYNLNDNVEELLKNNYVKNNSDSKIEIDDLISKNNLINCILPIGFNNCFDCKNLEFDDNGNVVRCKYYNFERVFLGEENYTYPDIIYDSIKKFDEKNNCIQEEGYLRNWYINSFFEVEVEKSNQILIKREFDYY